LKDIPEYLQRRRARIDALNVTLSQRLTGDQVLTVEFGCGHGHFLTAYAAAHPEATCLGLDLVSQRVRKANAKAQKAQLANLHFIKAEAIECLEAWPQGVEIKECFMLFPDPWPKKRHHKKRMVQADFLDMLAHRSSPSAPFYFRTDHAAYFNWTRDVLQAHPRWRMDESRPWPFEHPSFFQNLMESWHSLIAVKAG